MARGPKFNTEEIAEFCKTRPQVEAEQHFDCSRATVVNACRKHGVLPVTKPNARRYRVAQWIRDNPKSTTEDVISEFKISRSLVTRIIHEFGLSLSDLPPPIKPVSPTQFEVLALLWQGHTQADIASELFVSRQRVEQIQRKAEEYGLLGSNSFLQLKDQVNA